MSDEATAKPGEGDLVWWHNPSEEGRRDAHRGFYHDDSSGIYIIPEDGGDRVDVGPFHVHHDQRVDTCVWCPQPAGWH